MISRIARVGRVARAGGGAEFTPNTVPGRFFDYNAALLTGNDGDLVASIPDAFNINPALAQATATNKGTLKLAIQNGMNILRLDGVDNFMNVIFGAGVSQPLTIFFVANYTVAGDGVQRKFFDSTNRVLAGVNGNTTHQQYAGTLATGGVPTSGWHLFVAKYNGVGSYMKRDGTTIVSGNVGAAAMTDMFLGTDPALGNFAPMDFGEIQGFANLSDSNELAIQDYLKSYWGLLF